jgi:ferredoxin
MIGRVHQINASCTLCGACIQVCPTESIFLGRIQYLIDSDTCDGSAVCVKVCPVDAIVPFIEEIPIKPPAQAP